jgi:16S rRNA (uracil1498-N3)-methyltransferase
MADHPAVTPHTAAAHVIVESVDEPVLVEDDRHHLERVLRLRPGSAITVTDGAGRWRPVGLGSDLEPLGPVVAEPPPAPRLTVAFAIVKGDRPELMARALTEVGVDRLVPMATVRGVVRWSGDRGRDAVQRLRRVVRSAGMQSRRVWVPEVAEVADVAAVVAEAAAREAAAGTAPVAAQGVAAATLGGPPPSLRWPTVLIGPEGGWAPDELPSGLPVVGLGPHVLRTETAAIVAGSLLVAARCRSDGLGRPG